MTRDAHRAFTLVELLVAVAIIAVVGAVTVIAVRTVGRDVRLSSGQNSVTAALANARALAMKNNNMVLVAFRAKPIDENRQVVEAITAQYTGGSFLNPAVGIVDRFVPVPSVAVRELPEGIKVAVPQFAYNTANVGAQADTLWDANTDFPALRLNEASGVIIGVLYGPDGTTMLDNPRTDSLRIYVDFDGNGLQWQGFGNEYDNISNFPDNGSYCAGGFGFVQFFCQAQERDEPYITFAPYVAVYDDEQARSLYDTSGWNNEDTRILDLSDYINQFGERIHFNRYTGVIMPTEDR